MAAATATDEKQNAQPLRSGLRPVNIRTDLAGIAELIEICFGALMDESSRAALREKKMISRSGFLLRLFSGLNWLVGGLEHGMVWVEEGRVVGNVSVMLTDVPRSFGPGYAITNVAVHPDYRRRGLARQLMRASLEMVRQKGGKFAILQVEANNDGARTLYENLGFRAEQTIVRWHRSSYLRPPLRLPDMPFITQRQAAEWRAEYELACLARPNEQGGLGWQRPTHPDLFRPSLWRAIGNLLSGRGDERWIVRHPNGQGIVASLHVLAPFGSPSRLDLLVHPDYRQKYEEPLLNFVLRRYEHQHRPTQIEHLLDDAFVTGLLPELGFERRNTFINMRMEV